MKKRTLFLGLALISTLWSCQSISQSNLSIRDLDLNIPLGGNSWIHPKSSEGITLNDNGINHWTQGKAYFDTYFKTDTIGTLLLGIKGNVDRGISKIKVSINGESKEVTLKNNQPNIIPVGEFKIAHKGYQKVEISAISRSDNTFANISDLCLGGEVIDHNTQFVKNEYYWGHRGPSVHLNYPVKANDQVTYFYNQVIVPKNNDVVGSYYMADGFNHGYFGMQANSDTERRVLFSVWSPHKTNDPNEIPESQKIKLLKKGDKVHAGKFGGEGSGGQSYMKYNWKTDTPYGFLLKAEPIKNNYTNYTAWFFAPEVGKWQLIASFSRPQTQDYLQGLYSFLENFNPTMGDQTRKVLFTNQWVYSDKKGWTEMTKAKFTADNTARKMARMDYAGGSKANNFYLKNCGFFSNNTPIDSWVTREPHHHSPTINFNALP